MDLIQPSGEQPSLDEIRAQFEQWHHSRDKRKTIPEAFWKKKLGQVNNIDMPDLIL